MKVFPVSITFIGDARDLLSRHHDGSDDTDRTAVTKKMCQGIAPEFRELVSVADYTNQLPARHPQRRIARLRIVPGPVIFPGVEIYRDHLVRFRDPSVHAVKKLLHLRVLVRREKGNDRDQGTRSERGQRRFG